MNKSQNKIISYSLEVPAETKRVFVDFGDGALKPIDLKRGRPIKKFCKTLDARLVDIAYDALKYSLDKNKSRFRILDIFGGDPHKYNDFQKLGAFGIVRKVGEYNLWEFTERGFGFLVGGWFLPKRVWVRRGYPIEESEEKITAESVSKRWQEGKQDFALDYLPLRWKYRVSPEMARTLF